MRAPVTNVRAKARCRRDHAIAIAFCIVLLINALLRVISRPTECMAAIGTAESLCLKNAEKIKKCQKNVKKRGKNLKTFKNVE